MFWLLMLVLSNPPLPVTPLKARRDTGKGFDRVSAVGSELTRLKVSVMVKG